MYLNRLQKKFAEAIRATGPIILLVLALSFSLVPVPANIMLSFLFGSVLLIVGMMFFSIGAELAMETMGEKLGAKITRTKKLWLILLVGFILGFMVTMAEPDLQVLGNQITTIPTLALVSAVAGGVGMFLVIAFLRMVFKVPLRIILLISYAAVFLLSIFAPRNFLAIAFDAGGVTTGPMTVPFILSFGIGIAAIRRDKEAADDSFGLIALCSVGPILAVVLLSIFFKPESVYDANTGQLWSLLNTGETVGLRDLFIKAFPTYLTEIGLSLLPIVVFFALFQVFSLKLDRHNIIRIGVGLLYTYFGLVIFMTGVNVGFLPVGTFLGGELARHSYRWIIIPVGMLIGFFIVTAEPAIYVLTRQVEEITNGMIKGSLLKWSLAASVAVSVGLSLVRVLTGIPIYWFIIPGYALAVGLSFFTPKIFTAIAFDSGGVASGPMTATFLLPFAIGACGSIGGNITTDAFGVVSMVAMTPLLAIQMLGIVFAAKEKKAARKVLAEAPFAVSDPYLIIEL